LDMGRIFQATLWVWTGFKRSMRIACYTSFVVAAGLIGWWLVDMFVPNYLSAYVGGLTFLIAVWVAQTAWNELQMVEAGEYDDLDEPWRQTFRYHSPKDEKSNEPGFIARWAARREEAKAQKDAEDQKARAARLDDVLRRVAQVGMDGLSAEEKAFLDEESARLREKR